MKGITDKDSGGTTLVSYAYTYDAAELVSQEMRTWDSGPHRYADLRLHEQRPVDQRDALGRLVLERELLLGCQRQRDRLGLHHDHGQRADGVARLYVYIRRQWQHDHDDGDVDG